MEQEVFSIAVSFVSVVFVFLFAVKKFSNQIQRLLGNRFKNILERFTNTPLKGALVGAGVTSIIQASGSNHRLSRISSRRGASFFYEQYRGCYRIKCGYHYYHSTCSF